MTTQPGTQATASRTVLVTGAAGYVAGRLLPRLVQGGARVRCLARWPESLAGHVPEGVRVISADVLDRASLAEAMAGVEIAFYLDHAPGASGDSEEHAGRTARVFGAAAHSAGLQRIIYLGRLGADLTDSPRGRGHHGVAEALRSSGVPVVELRSAIVLGPGSPAYELASALVERLPVMVTPRWARKPIRPVFVGDLLDCLLAAMDMPADGRRSFAIGGPEVVTFEAVLREYARERGLRRRVVPIAVPALGLSRLLASLVSVVNARDVRDLIDRVELSGDEEAAGMKAFAVWPIGVSDAMALSMRTDDAELPRTRWSQAMSTRAITRHWGGTRFGNRLVDSRVIEAAAAPGAAFAAIERIGGGTGWYSAPRLWQLRGWMDEMIGGVGMRRGRRDPAHLAIDDVVDCWRVEAVERGRRLLLAAEMRLPGRGWLEFEVRPGQDARSAWIRQTAVFDPLGVSGLAYWYALWPGHQWVFARMLRGVANAAERLDTSERRAQLDSVARE